MCPRATGAAEDTWTVLRAQTGRLRRLAEDIAAVSRAEEHQLDLHRRPVAAVDLVTAAVTAARSRCTAKGVGLDERVAADLPPVHADPDRIGQVLGNLLDNALRHTPSGGRVTITADAHAAGIRVSVSDTGEGIDPAHLPNLFERFYRADPARGRARDRGHGDQGSGIGLAIARAIVIAHGGRITASSDGPGRGATFTLTLPTEAQPPAE
jgi:two-component system sensor histidine kinase BaeS